LPRFSESEYISVRNKSPAKKWSVSCLTLTVFFPPAIAEHQRSDPETTLTPMRCLWRLAADCQAICRTQRNPFASPSRCRSCSSAAVAASVTNPFPCDYSRGLGVGPGNLRRSWTALTAAAVVVAAATTCRVKAILPLPFFTQRTFNMLNSLLPVSHWLVLWQHQPSLPISLTGPVAGAAPRSLRPRPSHHQAAVQRILCLRKDSGFGSSLHCTRWHARSGDLCPSWSLVIGSRPSRRRLTLTVLQSLSGPAWTLQFTNTHRREPRRFSLGCR